MASLACKVARTLPAAPSRMLAVAARKMHSRSSGLMEPLEKPWPYKQLGYSYPMSLIDGTTKRFKDNSKLVVVEGPPALDKTKFAKELADEFGMLFVPGFTMEDYYINAYGYDLRELDFVFKYTRNKSFDEKLFAQDPTANDHGLDRMLYYSHVLRYKQYVEILAHIFNTGQGVVTERSPHSDWVYFEAAYQQGWISKTTRQHYFKLRDMMMVEILRPNLIVHLDAPIDVVQRKIRERAEKTHPWEKNSPVYENTGYLNHLYNDLFKKQYLQEAGIHSYVLSYDWSDGGDTEVVVEDIERMNMDYHDKYDKQQLDWRMLTEDNFGQARYNYTGDIKWRILGGFVTGWHFADDIILTSDEAMERERVSSRLPGSKFVKGFNVEMGDPDPFFGILRTGKTIQEQQYVDSALKPEVWMNNSYLAAGDLVREKARAAGDKDWWKKGWDTWTPHLAESSQSAA